MYHLESEETPASEYPRSFAVFDLVRFVWRRKAYLLLTLPLAVIAGVAAYKNWTPQYLSEAQLLVVKKSPQTIPGVNTQFAEMEDTLAIHAAVIRSPLLVGEAIENHNLTALPSLANQENATACIIDALNVSPSWHISNQDSSALLNLSYVSTHPEDSAAILTAVLRSYEEFLASLHRADSEESAQLYKQWRDEVQDQLTAKQQAYEQLKQSDLLAIGLPAESDVARSRLDRVDSARLDQSIRKTELTTQLKTLEELRDQGAGPAMLIELAQQWRTESQQDPEAALRDRLVELRLTEQTMLTKFGPRHPDLKAVRRQIELVEGQQTESSVEVAHNPADFYIELIRQELEGVEKVEASLSQAVEEERGRVEDAAEKRDRFETLRGEIDRIQELHTEIVKQVQGVDLVKESKSYQAQLITPPALGEKVAPSLTAFVFIFAFLGVFSGAGMAVYAEATDQRIRNADEVRQRLSIPVLAQIPEIRRNGRNPRDAMLCAYYAPESASTEAYRRLRTAVFFRDPHEQCSLLQVTSPDSGDGSSTVAANLAISIAQAGKTVLLIDANLRSPSLGAVFGLESDSQAGFADLLDGFVEADQVICETVISKLSLIPAGANLDSPAEVLASPQLPELLQAASTRFDYVVIDTPALLSVSDPGMVAPHVDGVLLTVNVASAWPRLAQAKEMLDSLNVRIIGAAANRTPVDARSSIRHPRIGQLSGV